MNNILATDSYKASHFRAYPPGATAMYSYFESRGGDYDKTVFFGLQYLIEKYLYVPVWAKDIGTAEAFFATHGERFNEAGWHRIMELGYFPIRITAVPEGSVVPVHTPLFTVESTDPETFWIVSYLETMFVRLWYPITVATRSWHIKRMIMRYLAETSDGNPTEEVLFKLHDFGARGASSAETAAIGGAAHLVNFRGSDTVEGIDMANRYYRCDMAGFSIPAAEHSTVTMWGRDGEFDAYRRMLSEFAKPGALVAVVSDSYDIWNAIGNGWCGELLDDVRKSGATVVIRPDSGYPTDVVLDAVAMIGDKCGTTRNKKGYKMLPPYFRLIQGDGVSEKMIEEILLCMKASGWSASNIAFGMGGELLQKMNRDTNKFAFKCSAACVDGQWRDVSKSPVGDLGKASKAGRVEVPGGRVVFENGRLLVDDRLEDIRARADATL